MSSASKSFFARYRESFPNLPVPDDSRVQTLANHRQIPPMYMAAGAVLGLDTLWRVWELIHAPYFRAAWAVCVGLAIMAVLYYSRRAAVAVQNRVIRLEMRLRLERVLPREQQADAARLSLGQLVALRFAGDEELPALVRAVLAENIMSQNEIKRRIKNWQPDWVRA